MNTVRSIQIPDDFRLLCDIFGFTPGGILQNFADLVSLPKYLINPSDHPCYSATDFLITQFIYSGEIKTPPVLFEKYQKKLAGIVDSGMERQEKEQDLRNVLLEWHSEIRWCRVN